MKRKLEPELMEAEAQVKAYAEADFSQPNNLFLNTFSENFTLNKNTVLDLGCGSGDLSLRFAKAYPKCSIHAIDGSATMLKYAKNDIRNQALNNVFFYNAYLPTNPLPLLSYDVIMSNSLLHHLPEPTILWETLKLYAKKQTAVFIMDLKRPATSQQAQELVKTYAASEPEILQHDFYHSLLAAFEIEEVQAQLTAADLKLTCKSISDRHFIVYGYLSK